LPTVSSEFLLNAGHEKPVILGMLLKALVSPAFGLLTKANRHVSSSTPSSAAGACLRHPRVCPKQRRQAAAVSCPDYLAAARRG
jgi:hypothetical protein